MVRFFSFCIVLFLVSLCPVHASKPNVMNFYRNTYHAANKNWAIAQDSLGIMYFGNDKGLLEFDGIRWKLYTLPVTEIIRAVSTSGNNHVFTGGYEEFGIWKRAASGELVYTSLSENLKKTGNLHNDDIWKIYVTDSLVYFQSFGHIYEYDYKTVRVVDTKGAGVLFLLHVYDKFIIQKMSGSLCWLERDGLKEIPGSSFLGNTEVRLVLPFEGKKYLIGTSNMGLYVFDGTDFLPWNSEFSNQVKPYQLNNGILGDNGNYIFGTILNGLYEVSPSGAVVNHFSTGNFLQNNTVLALYKDMSNNVWAALDRGISYIQYLRDMDCYTDPLGKAGAVYSAAFFENKLFLGTNQGVFYLPKDQLNSSDALPQLKMVDGTQGQIWDIKVVGDRLLCAHNNGLRIIDRNLKVSSVGMPGVFSIQQGNSNGKGMLLMGTYSNALLMTGDYKIINSFKDLNEPISAIETDHLENIWLEHAQKGLYRYRFDGNGDNVTFHGAYGGESGDGLPYRLSLFKLGNRVMFYGNDTFFIYNDLEDKIVVFEEMNDCFSGIKSLKNLVSLSDHLFMAISNNCVYKVHYDNLEVEIANRYVRSRSAPIFDPQWNLKIVDRYDVGYNNLSLVNSYENAVALNDSLALICLDDGFLLQNINQQSGSQHIPQTPFLREVAAIDLKTGKRDTLMLKRDPSISYARNTLLFDFFAKDVLARNLSFQYKLEGVDSEWSVPDKIHEVLFERLPEGKYTFFLRTVDGLGNASIPVSFSFSILPPWYASTMAYVSYFVLFILIMTGIWFMILRRYRNAHLLKVRVREDLRLRRQNMNLQREIEEKNAELFSQTSFIIQKNELIMKVKKEIDGFYESYSGNKILKPLYTKVESLLNQNMDVEEDWKMFLIQFEQQHTGFFKRMKEIQPDLTPNDLKLCACLKLNLSSKDIASLMNISLRAVENSRHRLRKKLNIPHIQNLNDYFMSL